MYRFGGTLAGWYDNTAPADVCGAERQDRTYSTRGRDVASFETPIILGLVWITRQQQQLKWVCVFCGLCAPIFASILVIVIVIVFWVFRYGRDNYRYRYRYRRYFGLIVPKPFWFRYRTLALIRFIKLSKKDSTKNKRMFIDNISTPRKNRFKCGGLREEVVYPVTAVLYSSARYLKYNARFALRRSRLPFSLPPAIE